MDRRPPDEALAFADATREALARLGGVDLARRAESDPRLRRTEVGPALAKLGLLDLVPLSDPVETIAAAFAVREAGAVVCPWPLVAMLSVTSTEAGEHDAVYVVQRSPRRLEHLDLLDSPLVLGLRGGAWVPAVRGRVAQAPLDPFGVTCEMKPSAPRSAAAALSLYVVLDGFWILGALQTVATLSARYARERHQFGRPIGQFGAVRWRLADLALAQTGLEELAMYTLWRLVNGTLTRADVYALRSFALEAAGEVLTHGHQVFAAIGLCDEHDLSIIDRHLQPSLRRPGGLAVVTELLADAVSEEGFDALFPIPPERTSLRVGGRRPGDTDGLPGPTAAPEPAPPT